MRKTPRFGFSFLLVFALLLTMAFVTPAMAQTESDDYHQYYEHMFSDLHDLYYKNPVAYAAFFDNDRYIPNVTVITDIGWEFTGYQDINTGHVISHEWDRLLVYDQDGECIFRLIVEP